MAWEQKLCHRELLFVSLYCSTVTTIIILKGLYLQLIAIQLELQNHKPNGPFPSWKAKAEWEKQFKLL